MRDALIALVPPLGFDAHVYDGLARALEGHAEVVLLDYPGFGSEPRVFDWRDEQLLERLADDLALQFRTRAAGRTPSIVGGVSLGGTLSYGLARALEARSMLLMAPGGLPVASARREAVLTAMREWPPERFAPYSLGLEADGFDESSFAAHFPSRSADARACFDHLRAHTWATGAGLARANAYVALLRAALDVDLSSTLRTNAIPTDLVWGEDDRVFSTRVCTRYARVLSNARLHLLPSVGHFAPLDAPAKVARIVRARLEELRHA